MTDAVKMAKEALQRIANLTPERANAVLAKDLHLTVQAIAETALDRLAALEQAGEPVAVGVAGEMPGSNGGFSMAVFKASDVPIGASLYAQPPLPTLQRLGQEFDAGEAQGIVKMLIDTFSHWIEIGADKQPHFPNGLRPWGSGELQVIVDQLSALYAHPPQSRGQAFDGEGEARKILRAISARMTIACDWTKAGKDHIKVRTADWHVLMEIGQQARALSSAKRGEG